MYILFSIVGGIGKCIAATAVVKVLRKTFPNHKIVVISQFPNIFKNNPNVDITHKNEEIISNMVYFKYLKNKDTKVFLQEPYEHHDMITGESHLIKTWCTMFGLEYNNEQPEIFLTNEEQKYYEPFYETDKPFFVFQSNGGMLGSDNLGQKPGFNWVRDIPEFTMKQIIEEYRDYYHIVHIKRPDQIRLDFMYHNNQVYLNEFTWNPGCDFTQRNQTLSPHAYTLLTDGYEYILDGKRPRVKLNL